MKKRLRLKNRLLVLALVLALCLAGCTGQAAPASTEAPEPTEAPAPETTEAPLPASANDAPVSATADSAPAETEEPEPNTEGQPDDGSFRFTRENFPRLDGSTSLVPLGEAVASVLLGESREDVQDLLNFNRTTQSYRNLMWGNCDLLLASVPNASIYDELAEEGFEIDAEEICTEALVFMVNEDNPIESLTTEQLRDIYSGKITNWKEVGGNDAEIVPFQRNEGAGSQALMRKLVMQDLEFMEAPKDYVASEMGELMESLRNYDNSANAIGYSVFYYAHEMEMARGLKLIAVDGVLPSSETIRAREYPHLSSYYCVIPADAPEGSPNRVIYDWLMTEEGQHLIAAEGYVSVMDVG